MGQARQALNGVTKQVSRKSIFEGLRFILGGISSTVVCFGSFFLLLKVLGLHYLICTNLATFIAWGYAYLINKYLVFRDHRSTHVSQGGKYILLQSCLLGLSNILMFLQIDVFGWSLYVALFLMTAVVTVINFVVLKLVVFARGPVDSEGRLPLQGPLQGPS